MTVVLVGDVDTPLLAAPARSRRDRDPDGNVEMSEPESQDEGPIAVELLDVLVPSIRHVDVAGAVGGDSLRGGELSLAGARRSPPRDEVPIRVEHLPPRVAPVGGGVAQAR